MKKKRINVVLKSIDRSMNERLVVYKKGAVSKE